MYYIQYLDLFDRWQYYTERAYETLEDARAACLLFADVTDMAHRITNEDGVVVDVIDLGAEFGALGEDGHE